MDEMVIKSKAITSIISSILCMFLKKQLGISCDIKIHEISFHNTGEKTNIRLDLEGDLATSEIQKLFSHKNPIL